MITSSQILTFGAACVALIAIPGPSVLFIVGRALASGRRAALSTVWGNALGTYTIAVLVALGFGPILQRFPSSLVILKFVGAAFLCWLGIASIRNRKNAIPRNEAGVPDAAGRDWAALRQGYIVGATNPKAFIVFAIIMPPFLRADAHPMMVQMLALAVIPALIGVVCDSAWAAFSGTARQWFARSASHMEGLGLMGGVLMIGLGLMMAAT
jgi:threonine/homoserine/homoserine lactone efflux protein